MEILDWINTSLKLKLTKVEDTCNGAVACQIVDSLFPGVVQMNKVNWGAKSEWEYVANYKVLQAAFSQLKIDRKVDVDKLIKGKYQDNLEFCQWLKKFASNNNQGGNADYNPIARRNLGKNVPVAKSSAMPVSSQVKKSGVSRPFAARAPTEPPLHKPVIHVVPLPVSAAASNSSSHNELQPVKVAASKENDALSVLKAENALLSARIRTLEAEEQRVEKELRSHGQTLEKERDFYFSKLRDIELLLENLTSGDNLVESLTAVLYATEEGEDDAVVEDAYVDSEAADAVAAQ